MHFDVSEKILKKISHGTFRPMPLLSNGHSQTLAASFWPSSLSWNATTSQFHHLPLLDRDQLVLAEDKPEGWVDGQRMIVLTHGLTGCYLSSYMVRNARSMYAQGFNIIRVNQRGCGPGVGLSKGPAHSGRSEDHRAVLEWLQQRYPSSPVTLIGFSLGGNVVLKLAGEDGSQPTGNLDSVVAVSPPIDLGAAANKICHRKNRLYNYHFTKRILNIIEANHFTWPKHVPRPGLKDIDEHYTAPEGGFKDASDYYKACSSQQFLPSIRIPTLVIAAMDDPVIDTNVFLQQTNLPSSVDLLLTTHGGHVGFMARPQKGRKPFWWCDSVMAQWVLNGPGLNAKVAKDFD
jgi:predicted alpha/beta-fold hydrolase